MTRNDNRAAKVAPDDRPASPAASEARELVKTYGRGEAQVTALAGVDVTFASGAFTAIMGPSGSGKSTLLNCLSGLERPTSGEVLVNGTALASLTDRQLTVLRRHHIGFIFQAFNLVPGLNARENILLPLEIARSKPDHAWFDRVVAATGLGDRLRHMPHELSGGEQQRVACARALVPRPGLIFADEPTGNLDTRAGARVLELLRRAVDDFGQTVIMVTHDPGAASRADRVVFLRDGRLVVNLVSPDIGRVSSTMASLVDLTPEATEPC